MVPSAFIIGANSRDGVVGSALRTDLSFQVWAPNLGNPISEVRTMEPPCFGPTKICFGLILGRFRVGRRYVESAP